MLLFQYYFKTLSHWRIMKSVQNHKLRKHRIEIVFQPVLNWFSNILYHYVYYERFWVLASVYLRNVCLSVKYISKQDYDH